MMYKYSFFKVVVWVSIIICSQFSFSQNSSSLVLGDLAFTSFNADGDGDFSIVALTEIAAGSNIYFSDGVPFDITTGTGEGMVGSATDGFLKWSIGSSNILAGTTIVFTDVSHANRAASIGTLEHFDAVGSTALSLEPDGDALFAFNVQDFGEGDRVSNWICGIQNSANQVGNDFGITGLTVGTNFIEFFTVGSPDPDGGYYNGVRDTKTNFSEYLTETAQSANWQREDDDGENILPISTENFYTLSNWSGSTGSGWSESSNWSNGIPDLTTNVVVPNAPNPISITSGTTALAGKLTIDPAASLSIGFNNSLTVAGEITNNGALTIFSSGSLIAKNATNSISLTYNRLVTNGWHLISSPINDQFINGFYLVAGNQVATNLPNIGIATYLNDGSNWNYYTSSNISSAGKFTPGKGYAALRNSTGNFTFTGLFPTSDTTISINDGTANEWNLIGNPYPAYIPANNAADAVNNILVQNTAILHAAFQAIYFWDSASSSYIVVNHASPSRFIAPGQGFFVRSIENGGSSTFNFTEDMQNHQSTETFNRVANEPFNIQLKLSSGTATKSTDIRFMDGTTTGLDPGYDAGLFDTNASGIRIASHLVTNGDGVDFALQCLPNYNFEDMIIPISVRGSANDYLTFSLELSNKPDNIRIYLEDRLSNQLIRLGENNAKYKIKLLEDIHGAGRFYLHTKYEHTSDTPQLDTNPIRFFVNNQRELNIVGFKDQANLKVYDILGKKVLDIVSSGSSVKISKNISPGIYIVQLIAKNATVNSKIVIE